MDLAAARKAGFQIWVMVRVNSGLQLPDSNFVLGITPNVDPDTLKFYFKEIHRLTGRS